MGWDRRPLARVGRHNFIDRWVDNKSYEYSLSVLISVDPEKVNLGDFAVGRLCVGASPACILAMRATGGSLNVMMVHQVWHQVMARASCRQHLYRSNCTLPAVWELASLSGGHYPIK